MRCAQGRWGVLAAAELVPGDVVEVAVGGKIPADMRIVQLLSSTLRIDQVQLGQAGKERGRWRTGRSEFVGSQAGRAPMRGRESWAWG